MTTKYNERRQGEPGPDAFSRDRNPQGEASFQAELGSLRFEIDGLDAQILTLLNERMERAVAIGRAKDRFGGHVLDQDREAVVLHRLHGLNQGPLSAEGIDVIYGVIMAVSRELQRSGSLDETEA